METITATATVKNEYKSKPRPKVREYAIRAGGILQYGAAIEQTINRVMIENAQQAGKEYKPFTTFASDFAMAECFGDDAILDTYNRASRSWVSDYKYFTELVMVLNHLCWFWYYNKEKELSALYGDLYYKAVDAFDEYWGEKDGDTEEDAARKDEACSYYYNVTD